MKKSALIPVFLTALLLAHFSLKGQKVHRMDPPNWWINHPLDTVEILLQGEDLFKWAAEVEKPVGKVLKTTHYGDHYSPRRCAPFNDRNARRCGGTRGCASRV